MTVEVENATISRASDKKTLKEEIDKNNKKSNNNNGIADQNCENEKNGFIKNNVVKNIKISKTNGLQRKNQEQNENNTHTEKCSQILVNSERNDDSEDDYFNILEGLDEEEEKRLRIQEYVNSLPQFLEAEEVEFSPNSIGKEGKDKSLGQQSPSDTRKSASQSPYIINNETLFSQKKIYSFNSYQLWKIRRDNEIIASRLQSLEKRRISKNFVNDVKRIPSSAAVAREKNLRKIEAENKTIEQEIQRIKERPNKKAPWYKPEGPWYLKNLEKNKKT